MPTVIDDGVFNEVAFVGPPRKSLRFEDDITSIILEQDCQQTVADWLPLALGEEHPSDNTLFLIAETPLVSIGGGISQWTRIYSACPATRNEWQSHNFRYPGKTETISAAWVYIDNATSTSTTINTTTAHGLNAGDFAQISYNIDANGQQVTRYVLREILTAPDSDTVTIDAINDIAVPTFFSIRPTLGTRAPRNQTVASKLVTDFFILGLANSAGIDSGDIATADDIFDQSIFVDQFKVTDVTGAEVESVSTETNPDRATYDASVTAGDFIVAEATIINRIQGILYSAATRYVKAL